MKKSLVFIGLFLALVSIVLSGCQAIGDIFKAGVWSGIIIVVLVVGLILYFIGRGRNS